MDKCPKCGNKLSSIDVLCPRCGSLVEVVQIKKGAGVQSASGAYASPVKKVPPQNLIVYNDDLPSDDIFSSTDSEPTAVDQTEPVVPTHESTETPAYNLPESQQKMHSEDTEVGTEEDYLALLRKMNLSALNDIVETAPIPHHDEKPEAAFTPQADVNESVSLWDEKNEPKFFRGNDNEESAFNSPDAEPEPASFTDAHRRWLEIEELAEDQAVEPEPMQAQSDLQAPPETIPSQEQHRYQPGRERVRKPSPRRSTGRIILMIFMWLVVTCAVFCGFYFFDQYVTDHYGSYPAMLQDLSGGQIEFGASAGTVPSSVESP